MKVPWKNKAQDLVSSIGAMQTLVENFPANMISFGNGQFNGTFDVIQALLKICGVSKDELIDRLTDLICGDDDSTKNGGFLSWAEEIIKTALNANLAKILNCTSNPMISDSMFDKYESIFEMATEGSGVTIDVGNIDVLNYLKHNPCSETGKKFYFDVSDKNMNDVWKSDDFNAYLWYIINKSDASQLEERIWNDRYRAKMWGEKRDKRRKNLIKCTYIDREYPLSDKIRVQICSDEFYRTRLVKNKNKKTVLAFNKTIFEFNFEFIRSIKLYDGKVLAVNIVDGLTNAFSGNFNFSINESIIESKVDNIIKNVIEGEATEINDCYYTFSNDEYNEMLEKSEMRRNGVVRDGNGNYVSADIPGDVEKDRPVLVDNRTEIKNTLTDINVTPGVDGSVGYELGMQYDWFYELMRAVIYPLVRPIFSPKVLLLLAVNREMMGSLEDYKNLEEAKKMDPEEFLSMMLPIVKTLIEEVYKIFMKYIMDFLIEKLTPLTAMFASRLLMETITEYRDILAQLYETCVVGWGNGSVNGIDNVNYADIVPVKEEPDGEIC